MDRPGAGHGYARRMATRLLLLSDTHVPHRARRLGPSTWGLVESADVVLHAGDWTAPAIHDELSRRSQRLVGVLGNNDGPELAAILPLRTRVEIEGVRFAMTHITSAAHRREAWADAEIADADVLVFGHSHIPWDSVTPRGLRMLNPGSPTDRRRQPECTVMTAVADDGELRDVRLVSVER